MGASGRIIARNERIGIVAFQNIFIKKIEQVLVEIRLRKNLQILENSVHLDNGDMIWLTVDQYQHTYVQTQQIIENLVVFFVQVKSEG